MNKPVTDQQLQQQIDGLQQDIKPSRDLWPGIELAIEHQQQESSPKKAAFAPYAWAASVMAAVLLTWMVNKPMQEQPLQLTAVEVIQQQYVEEKNTMLVSFGKPDISKLPAKIQKQFTELQSARESLLKALEDDPENPDLLNLLQWTQNQELSLLEQLYSPKWQTI
ncbi:hypothetical protein [Thalassomonas sp. M1454]|uniref:hypothetical protein n=1 Tax=Thalassomonas sp. M1454 TaxID=2594477 RepID=UPI00117F4B5B|nr:hypothetical protein [Thalassomonas sp. M1454]TRX53423.1 hypothetical protein FNN08_14210 [Thalassomonas sp. M1454]